MLKNYLVKEDLEGCHPALDNLLRQNETDFNKFKTTCERDVLNEFINRDYDVKSLRPILELDTVDAVEDKGNRARVVINVTSFDAGALVIILGCNTLDGTYETAGSYTIVSTGQSSFLLSELFIYYKYSITGTAVLNKIFIVESNYDNFYTFYWLHLIFTDSRRRDGDMYDMLAGDYLSKYNQLFTKAVFWYDIALDGDITDEKIRNNTITYTR